MKQCWRCGREIPETATFCDRCADEAADPGTPVLVPDDAFQDDGLPSFDATSDQNAARSLPAAPLQKAVAGIGRRELLTILIAVVFGGTVTLALLMASGARSPEAAGARGESPTRDGSTPATLETAAGRPKWNSTNRDWIGNQRNGIAFELPSENRVQVWQRYAQPILVVRCVSKHTEAFVFIESAAQIEPQENHAVRVRFDDEPEITERWPDSDDHDALFAPDAAAFVQRLTHARRMRFGYTPHNAQRVVADFPVSGLGELIQPVARECGASKK